jgi:hypothetical protein
MTDMMSQMSDKQLDLFNAIGLYYNGGDIGDGKGLRIPGGIEELVAVGRLMKEVAEENKRDGHWLEVLEVLNEIDGEVPEELLLEIEVEMNAVRALWMLYRDE